VDHARNFRDARGSRADGEIRVSRTERQRGIKTALTSAHCRRCARAADQNARQLLQVIGGIDTDVQLRPTLHRSDLQLIFEAHDVPLTQLMSHAQAVPQLISVHVLVPVHSTSHGPVLQLNWLQLPRPEQVTLHDRPAPGQVSPLLHELGVAHWTLQFQPSGQRTGALQAPPLSVQSTLHVLLSLLHDVHWVGQRLASIIDASTRGPSATLASACIATQ
jgi:hypothetical protein